MVYHDARHIHIWHAVVEETNEGASINARGFPTMLDKQLTHALRVVDDGGIDGGTVGVGKAIAGTSTRLRDWQSGYVRSYALSVLAGATVLVASVMAVML